MGEILVEQNGVTPEKLDAGLQKQAEGDPRRIGEILVATGAVESPAVVDALQTQNEQRAKDGSGSKDISSSTIRVDVGLLDRLMNLVGELVLARNQVLQFTAGERDSAFVATAQKLNLITTELQESVMKTRMQPIGNVWGKFPRIIRDLALSCKKKVQLDMDGAETELDKTIIEAIKDPLTHIIRNSVDHGIELPEDRVAAGKTETGRLQLRAFHEGGQVNIEIQDDGAGINVSRVKAKALERGLVTPAQISRMSEKEALNLIFLPGLSTAAKVTNISGRGVGMDVVKTNIEKIGGTIDLQSAMGAGTTIRIKIPLTLAIVPALIVTASGERFAIPQISLLELVRLEGEAVAKEIESAYGVPVYRLRGNLLPLVFLNKELKLSGSDKDHDIVNIVVLQANDRQFGLVVDEINDTEEIVVKPLGKQVKNVTCFAGATIMGDGRVALIIDVFGMAQRASITGDANHAAAEVTAMPTEADEKQQWLVFKAGSKDRIAIPLSEVARLEEINVSQIERSRGREVVQYRGEIMPLVRITKLVGLPPAEEREILQVIVCTEDGRSVGLVVDEIVDVAEEAATIREQGESQGLLGSAVIQQRVTDLLDISQAVAAARRGVARSKIAKVGGN
jgi:two-component system chemotaxis sensor kinase CheA